MTDYPATWLADVLRAGGCRVIEESGWKTRGRPASTGTFKPRAVLRHWDASSPGSHSTSTLINGNGSAPGPLCSIWTCAGNADHAPSVHVIAAGRTNHGGTGDAWGLIPADDANTYAVGHEIRQTSNEPWDPDQLNQLRRAEAAILAHLGEDTGNALCSHSEYAPDRKIDTTGGADGQSMPSERAAVQTYIDDPDQPPEDDVRTNYVAISTNTDREVTTTPARVTFDAESSDAGGVHGAGKQGVKAPYRCTITGVVELSVTAPCRVNIQREDGVDTAGDVPAGRSLVPFVGAWSEGEYLFVEVAASQGKATLGSVALQLTQVERA